MKTATMVLFLVLAAAAWGLAAEQPSLKRGEELFSNTQLGDNLGDVVYLFTNF